MSDATLVLDQAEEAILSFQVSDEALETAAGSVKENAFTLGSCTGYVGVPDDRTGLIRLVLKL